MTFFDSRWVEQPEHVRDVGAGLPAGFRAGAMAAGIKKPLALDLGVIVSDAEDTVSAARFTRSGVLAAPVIATQRARVDALRVVVANSGNANAATGERGLRFATETQKVAASQAGVGAEQVAIASTGVIGVPMDPYYGEVLAGLMRLMPALGPAGDAEFNQAIMTTDAFPKRASLVVTLPSGEVRLSAQAKGAGMIEPSFATMLCFVQTDAALSAETADLLLGVCVKRSFDRISVDGQLSTNDTVILQCSGSSGVHVAPESDDERQLGLALDALLRQLALLIVRDGEGSKRIGRVVVRGADQRAAERCARAIANSPLVKTALHGADPNWGRIAQAVGMAMGGRDRSQTPLALDITIEGIAVCRDGAAVEHDLTALNTAAEGTEIEYEVRIGPDHPDDGEAEVIFSDLGHEYVTINAEYTT